MKTVYDLWVFTPQGKQLVACTWRCDFASSLLGELVAAHDTGTGDRWTGAATWREVA